MNWEWISEKGASLTAGIIGLGFLLVAYLDRRYRYFHLCVADKAEGGDRGRQEDA